jgi:hypothetical protein
MPFCDLLNKRKNDIDELELYAHSTQDNQILLPAHESHHLKAMNQEFHCKQSSNQDNKRLHNSYRHMCTQIPANLLYPCYWIAKKDPNCGRFYTFADLLYWDKQGVGGSVACANRVKQTQYFRTISLRVPSTTRSNDLWCLRSTGRRRLVYR